MNMRYLQYASAPVAPSHWPSATDAHGLAFVLWHLSTISLASFNHFYDIFQPFLWHLSAICYPPAWPRFCLACLSHFLLPSLLPTYVSYWLDMASFSHFLLPSLLPTYVSYIDWTWHLSAMPVSFFSEPGPGSKQASVAATFVVELSPAAWL